MKAHIVLALMILCGTNSFSQNPPPPAIVANTVSNLWQNSNFTSLENYTTNLYISATNYIPAILASVFHDCVFRGDFQSATNKLTYIKEYTLTNQQQTVSDEFKLNLNCILKMSIDEISLHTAKGRSSQMLQVNASPQAVRETWEGLPLPYISILYIAPQICIP